MISKMWFMGLDAFAVISAHKLCKSVCNESCRTGLLHILYIYNYLMSRKLSKIVKYKM